MSEKKEKEIIVDIGDQTSQSNHKNEVETADELKQQAGELLKAAGGFASSLGKMAIKKGTQLKDKLEDEAFQEKVSSSVNKAANRVENAIGAGVAYKAKNNNTAKMKAEKNEQFPNAENYDKFDEIDTSFEVEGDEMVSFETEAPSKGLKRALENRKAEIRSEKERKRKEKERLRKEEQKQSTIIVIAALVFSWFPVLCFILIKMIIKGKYKHRFLHLMHKN